MKIRQVEPSQIPQLFALREAEAAFDGCSESLRATPSSLREALVAEKPRVHALVAEIDERRVGMATCRAIASSVIARPGRWLDDLHVDGEFRGRNVGRRLMRSLCQIARDAGCARVAWHVPEIDARGITFYRHIGARISMHTRLARLAIKELADGQT